MYLPLYVGILLWACTPAFAQSIDSTVQRYYPAAVLIRLQAVLAKVKPLNTSTQHKLAEYYLKEDKLILETMQKENSLTLTQVRTKVQRTLQPEFDKLLTHAQRVLWYQDNEAKQAEWVKIVETYKLADPDADSLYALLNAHYWEAAQIQASTQRTAVKELRLAELKICYERQKQNLLVSGAYLTPATEFARILLYKKRLQLSPNQVLGLVEADAQYQQLTQAHDQLVQQLWGKQDTMGRLQLVASYQQLLTYRQAKISQLLWKAQYNNYLTILYKPQAITQAHADWEEAERLHLTEGMDRTEEMKRLTFHHQRRLTELNRLDLTAAQQRATLRALVHGGVPPVLSKLLHPGSAPVQQIGFKW